MAESLTKDFQNALFLRVTEYFEIQGKSHHGNTLMGIKVTVLLIAWIANLVLLYALSLSFSGVLTLYFFHGVFSILLVFNVSHDAVHQAISSKRWINDALGYTFNLVGGNKYSWFLKHNVAHHTYTNVHGKDVDIETAPVFRISPYTKKKDYYKYQHLYIIPVYCVLSLVLIFYMDFRVMNTVFFRNDNRVREWIILLVSKSIYISYIILVPSWILPMSFAEILVCFLAMHALVGLVTSLVLLPSHFIEDVKYYQEHDKTQSWVEHQVQTTIDIAPYSKTANLLLGGLNTNVIHHIFPIICHVHLIPLSKIVSDTAKEYNISYRAYSLPVAMRKHFVYIKRMGKAV